jgi:hypothetical protein
MLKEDVVEAVKDGLFHIYAVRNIEEGIELLSGLPAGQPGEDGNYPEGTVFYLVDRKIQEYNDGIRKAGGNTRRKKTGQANKKPLNGTV